MASEKLESTHPKKLYERYQADWEKRFANHEVRETPVGWRFRSPARSMYQGEIVVLEYGNLLIHGDVPAILFYGAMGSKESRLEWLASSEPDYLAKKIKLGNAEAFVPDVALYELQAWSREEGVHEVDREVLRNAIATFVAGDDWEDRAALLRMLDFNPDRAASIGMTIHPDVFMAVAAGKLVKKYVDSAPENDH